MAFFDIAFAAIMEMFRMCSNMRMIRCIVVAMNQPPFGALFPVESVTRAIRTQPNVYKRAIAHVQPQLERRMGATADLPATLYHIAEFVKGQAFQGVIHSMPAKPATGLTAPGTLPGFPTQSSPPRQDDCKFRQSQSWLLILPARQRHTGLADRRCLAQLTVAREQCTRPGFHARANRGQYLVFGRHLQV